MFKPFVKFLCVTALANAVFAQNVFIALPKVNTTVTAGSSIVVQLDKPLPLGTPRVSTEVAVVIGAEPCTPECPDVGDVLGEILYNGPYNSQWHTDSAYQYQNFTVTIPASHCGIIQLGVAHIFLLGAGGRVQVQLLNTTLNVVESAQLRTVGTRYRSANK